MKQRDGTGWFCASLAAEPGEELLTFEQWKQVATLLELTRREQQVAQLLFRGMSRPEIADQLGVKLRTVREHMERLHTKLQVRNRVGVVLRIIQVRDQLES